MLSNHSSVVKVPLHNSGTFYYSPFSLSNGLERLLQLARGLYGPLGKETADAFPVGGRCAVQSASLDNIGQYNTTWPVCQTGDPKLQHAAGPAGATGLLPEHSAQRLAKSTMPGTKNTRARHRTPVLVSLAVTGSIVHHARPVK